MKLSSKILLAVLLLLVAGLAVSNLVLKAAYEKADKANLYWNYSRIPQEPFHHIHIDGGNVTRIAYEPSAGYAVGTYEYWPGYKDGRMKAWVSRDTLYIQLQAVPKDIQEENWIKWVTLIRVFSPAVYSISGTNTNFSMAKMKQKNMAVILGGKSFFRYESMWPDVDTLYVRQTDSVQTTFMLSPDIKPGNLFSIQSLDATIRGASFLDVGHATIDSLKLQVDNRSAIFLNGQTLIKNHFPGTGN